MLSNQLRSLSALLMLGSPVAAQLQPTRPEPPHQAGFESTFSESWRAELAREPSPAEEELRSVVVEGRVLHPDGSPAIGAVVVSSAGGLAQVGAGGFFTLESSVTPEVGALDLTAVANGPQGSLTARGRVEGLVPWGRTASQPMYLTAGSGGEPEWIPTFGAQPGVSTVVHSLAVFDDGSGPALYVGGTFTSAGGVAANRIARWDGQTWSPLGSGMDGIGTAIIVAALAVHDDGSGPALYAAGWFTRAGGVSANNIARWDGNTWSRLGTGVGGSVLTLVVHDDGSGPALFVGGWFSSAGGASANHIAKWDGSAWSRLGSGTGGGNPSVKALLVHDDGSGPALYAGGDFTSAGGVQARGIARWNGTDWSPVGGEMSGRVNALAAYDDGSGLALYAAGWFSSAGGVAAHNIAKWDGSAWSPLGGGLAISVHCLVVFDDGSGPALYAGGVAANNIAMWDGSAWSALGNGPIGSGWNGPVYSLVVHDDGSGPTLFAGGSFTSAGGDVAGFIARWNASAWSALGGSGWMGTVRTLTVFDDGAGRALYAGGHLASTSINGPNGIAKWDGSVWSPLGSGMNHHVHALAAYDDGSGPALYAGGSFVSADGVPASRIARWDGDAWSPLGSGLGGVGSGPGGETLVSVVNALAVHDDGSGPALFVAGWFTNAGGVAANSIAKWDGSTWSPLGGGILDPYGYGYDSVYALAVYDDGSSPALYAGGSFTHAGGVATHRIASWDGSAWSPLGSGLNGTVLALVAHDDGSGPALYAGGSFTTAGGVATYGIARWDGSAWSPLGSGLNGTVLALVAHDGGSGPALYAGGGFSSAGGVAANRIARWDGSSWSSLGRGLPDWVVALAVHDLGSGPALCVGGAFPLSPAGDSFLASWGSPSLK